MINQKELDNLFKEIHKVTNVDDIGFHRIQDGRINPIYKTNIGEIDIEQWQNAHGQNPVYIEDDRILQEGVNSKKTVVILNTREDKRTTDVILSFNIESLMMIPVINLDEVIGFILIVSIGKLHNFTEDHVVKCEALVKKYLPYLI